MSAPGLGDRWMSGERLDGVAFALHDRVRVTAGTHAGRTGVVALLLVAAPEPAYLVTLDDGGDTRVRQSALAAAR